MNYQKPFVYKMANNIKDVNSKSLHSVIPDFNINYSIPSSIKLKLADKQGLKCSNCRNSMLVDEIDNYKISYVTPLQYGGKNDPSNLKLLCPTCFSYRNF